jgi:hypothetical protein
MRHKRKIYFEQGREEKLSQRKQRGDKKHILENEGSKRKSYRRTERKT